MGNLPVANDRTETTRVYIGYHRKQIYVCPPTSAINVTLLAFAAERSAAELATAAVQNGTDTRTDGHRIVK